MSSTQGTTFREAETSSRTETISLTEMTETATIKEVANTMTEITPTVTTITTATGRVKSEMKSNHLPTRNRRIVTEVTKTTAGATDAEGCAIA